MHICFITSEYPKKGFPHGGLGSFVATIAPALVQRGVKVSVIGLNYINETEFENDRGVEIHRIVAKKLKGLQWYYNSQAINHKIASLHKQNPIDIIETPELGLAFLNKIKVIKYIIRLHGGHHFFAEGENRDINWWKGFQEKRSFKKADAFIGVSQYVKNHTEKYLSYNNKPIEIIPNPIDLKKFYPEDNIEMIDYEIAFAGTICEKKGIRQLIQAFQIVKLKYPNSTLQVYGRDWKFPNAKSYVQYLKDLFSTKELENVVFHGPVNHDLLPGLYQKAQVCVFPSHMETQGLVAPEAMAMEKCVIFSETGPGPETIKPYETGLLVNPLDPKDIAEKILWVFENPETVNKIGHNARAAALDKFNPENIVDLNISNYNKILL